MRWDEQKLRVFDVDDVEPAQPNDSSDSALEVPAGLGNLGGCPNEQMTSANLQPDELPDIEAEATASQWVERYVQETFTQSFGWGRVHPRQSSAGRSVLESSMSSRRRFVQSIVVRMTLRPRQGEVRQLQALLNALLRRQLEWNDRALTEIVRRLAEYSGRHLWLLPTAGIVRQVERQAASHSLSAELMAALHELRRLYKIRADTSEERRLYRRLGRLVERPGQDDDMRWFTTGDPWTSALAQGIAAETPESQRAWGQLLAHAETANSSAPRPAWRKQALTLLQPIGTGGFVRVLGPSLELFSGLSDAGSAETTSNRTSESMKIHESCTDLLRGLVLCAPLTMSDDLIPLLAATAEYCFERRARQQPRSLKIAGACIGALSMYRSPPAFRQLVWLRGRARHKSIQSKLAQTIEELCDRLNLPAHQIAELTVPDFNLNDVGKYRQAIGKCEALITIQSPGLVQQTWTSPGKRQSRSVPKLIKSYHSEALESVRRRTREIRAELPSQRLRLERLLMAPVSWSYGEFCRQYLNHRLIGPLARCLIWRLDHDRETVDVLWRDGALRDIDDRPIGKLNDGVQVFPWHPLMCDQATCLAWQFYIEEHEICQPFKQAHREVYSRSWEPQPDQHTSARFAGHLVEPFRLETIVAARQWSMHATERQETPHTPYWPLPHQNITVRWRSTPAPSEIANSDRFQANVQNIEFMRIGDQSPLPIQEVPDVVYSEAMREVECYFLQYGSFGNFPRGSQATHSTLQNYWQRVGFGPLTEQGRVRRDLIERLLPRSRLANRIALEGEFLRVNGDRNFYRIHLASGLIRMGPSEQSVHPYGYPFSVEHLGLPPGRDFPRLPFGGDIRLACILRTTRRLATDSNLSGQRLLDRFASDR